MNTPAGLLCSSFIFFLFTITPCSSSSDDCRPSSCNDITGPEIRFPFRIIGRQPERCGYPGFDLSCNDTGKTILTLPSPSGDFVVNEIDYASQIIRISDPDNCLSEKFLNIPLADSLFRDAHDIRYTILRCPGNWGGNAQYEAMLVPCQRNTSNSVVAVRSPLIAETWLLCTRVAENVSIPMRVSWKVPGYWGVDWLELTWNKPNCWDCESRKKRCGLRRDQGLEIACSNPHSKAKIKGVPSSAKYGIIIIIGAGIPSLLCISGLVFCTFHKIRKFGLNPQIRSPELPIIATMQLPPMPVAGGLDRLTIESYPKIILGESWQLPKRNDNTCSICLTEYQSGEILRTIPACNHYFHAKCIDEWLGLNASCPLCRKSHNGLKTESHSSMLLS